MKIEEKFSNKIIEITNKTDMAIRTLGFNQYNLHMLAEQKQKLLQSIAEYSVQKQNIIAEISQQYGDGYLNPQTWEFTKKQQNPTP